MEQGVELDSIHTQRDLNLRLYIHQRSFENTQNTARRSLKYAYYLCSGAVRRASGANWPTKGPLGEGIPENDPPFGDPFWVKLRAQN